MPTVARDLGRLVSRPGDGLDGVGMVSIGSRLGSGTLLEGGRAVLTAAHVVDAGSLPIRVAFDTPGGRSWSQVAAFEIHPAYDAGNFSNDLALLWLEQEAGSGIPRYGIYRDSDELGQITRLVGYGATGTGQQGHNGIGGEQRSIVHNRFEASWGELSATLRSPWSAPGDSQLMADFDDGSARHDAFGRFLGRHDTGLGANEGLIAPGDSGGPAFIGDRVAGVAGYITSLTGSEGLRADINARVDSSFGEIGAWQRVSYYQSWIDETLAGWALRQDRHDGPADSLSAFAGQAEDITLLYAAALDRRPDNAGLNYWLGRMEDGMALVPVAEAFARSEEFITRFGVERDAEYIERLYLNSLDREPDEAGFDYWLDVMEAGQSRAEVLIGFALSDENRVNTPWLEGLHYDTDARVWFL